MTVWLLIREQRAQLPSTRAHTVLLMESSGTSWKINIFIRFVCLFTHFILATVFSRLCWALGMGKTGVVVNRNEEGGTHWGVPGWEMGAEGEPGWAGEWPACEISSCTTISAVPLSLPLLTFSSSACCVVPLTCPWCLLKAFLSDQRTRELSKPWELRQAHRLGYTSKAWETPK